MSEEGRWAGVNPEKDAVRHEVWTALERDGVAAGPVWSTIPDFSAAEAAADQLAGTPEWERAKSVATSADVPQTPVRLRALAAGKIVYVPVPDLSRQRPYLRLDAAKLRAKGVSLELAATPEGFSAHGEPTFFDDVPMLDLCVIGSLAVTRVGDRIGSGSGLSDLLVGILREIGMIGADTIVATTVHSSQIVADGTVPLSPHDNPLDLIATETEVIRTGNTVPRQPNVDWHRVLEDQYVDIPFLIDTKDILTKRRQGA